MSTKSFLQKSQFQNENIEPDVYIEFKDKFLDFERQLQENRNEIIANSVAIHEINRNIDAMKHSILDINENIEFHAERMDNIEIQASKLKRRVIKNENDIQTQKYNQWKNNFIFICAGFVIILILVIIGIITLSP